MTCLFLRLGPVLLYLVDRKRIRVFAQMSIVLQMFGLPYVLEDTSTSGYRSI